MDGRFRWTAVLTAIAGAAIVGFVSYNAGVSHGLAISPELANTPAREVLPYGWYRPWGFGFGLAPLLFLLFWFLVLRTCLWGGFHRRRWYYRDEGGAPSGFEEWHRRAHEHMKNEPHAQPQSPA